MGFLDFLSGIGDIFGEIASLVSSLFALLWNALVAVFNYLFGLQVAVIQYSFLSFGKIADFFKKLWQDYVSIAIAKIFLEIKKLYDWLHHILDPLLRWLQKIRKWYDTHVLPGMLKQLALIQRIRQYLVILRIFHVKWAQTLDNYLAEIQGRITASIALVRGALNQIISWIGLITDQTNVIRRSVLGSWLLSNLGALKRIVGYGANKPPTSAQQAVIDREKRRYQMANQQDHVQSLAMTGLTADDKTERDGARQGIANATGAPLPF